MFSAFFITFREVFEASIIIILLLSYLKKFGQGNTLKPVTLGIWTGIGLSFISGILIKLLQAEFEGANEEIFEGSMYLITALLLILTTFWIIRTKNNTNFKSKLGNDANNKIKQTAIFILALTAVLREGIEIALFTLGAGIAFNATNIITSILGIVIAIALSYLIYKGIIKIKFEKIFFAINLVIVLIAANLLTKGISEFQEAFYGTVNENLLLSVIIYTGFIITFGVLWIKNNNTKLTTKI